MKHKISSASGLGIAMLLFSLLSPVPTSAGAAAWSAESIPGTADICLGPAGIDVRDIAVAADGTTVYAVPGNSLPDRVVYKSTDAGASWSNLDTDIEADLVAVAVEQFAPRYGRKPEDIAVEITGIRAGEKLDEALLGPHEQPRAEELEDMFVIHSFFDKEFDPSRTRQPEVSEYVSSKARLLSKEEILQLMKKADLL